MLKLTKAVQDLTHTTKQGFSDVKADIKKLVTDQRVLSGLIATVAKEFHHESGPESPEKKFKGSTSGCISPFEPHSKNVSVLKSNSVPDFSKMFDEAPPTGFPASPNPQHGVPDQQLLGQQLPVNLYPGGSGYLGGDSGTLPFWRAGCQSGGSGSLSGGKLPVLDLDFSPQGGSGYLGGDSGKLPVWRAGCQTGGSGSLSGGNLPVLDFSPQSGGSGDSSGVRPVLTPQAVHDCDGCGKIFPTPIGLRNHRARSEECPHCGYCKGRGKAHDCPICPMAGCSGTLIWGFGCNLCGPSAVH